MDCALWLSLLSSMLVKDESISAARLSDNVVLAVPLYDLDCCSSVSRSSLRKVDLIMAAGTMAMKMASALVRL